MGTWTMAVLAALALLAGDRMGGTAVAHEFEPPADTSGYAVPSIDHGAMAAIDGFRGRILALAAAVEAPDAELAALILHNGTQRANCLWLLVPGSVTDEASPLNLCAHAETAGLKAIVQKLRTVEETRAGAGALISDLDYAMVLHGTSFALCEYSGEVFNTASQVRPKLAAVPGYLFGKFMFELALILGFLFLALAGLRAVFPSRRSHGADRTPCADVRSGGEGGIRGR